MTRRSKKRSRHHDWDNEWETMVEERTYYDAGPKRLRRNKIDGMIGGVCAGIGDYLGIDPVIIRILAVVLFFTTGFPIFLYLILWVFVPSDKRAPYRREYREARKARQESPHDAYIRTATFKDVKSKFRSLETRLQDLEKSITSKDWQLRRQFRDLENN